MTAPRRIQRKRTKGWRNPAGALYVGRPSRWGNAFGVWRGRTAVEAVALFRAELLAWHHDARTRWLEPLRGHDLACWCGLCPAHADGRPVGIVCADCPPCHADVLLSEAN